MLGTASTTPTKLVNYLPTTLPSRRLLKTLMIYAMHELVNIVLALLLHLEALLLCRWVGCYDEHRRLLIPASQARTSEEKLLIPEQTLRLL